MPARIGGHVLANLSALAFVIGWVLVGLYFGWRVSAAAGVLFLVAAGAAAIWIDDRPHREADRQVKEWLRHNPPPEI